MRKNVNKIRKTVFLSLALLSGSVFAQEANDGFIVPLNEDLKNAIIKSNSNPGIGDAVVIADGAATPAGGKFSNLSMGLWVQTQSVNESLIRNVSDHKKKGYEFDNAHFLTEANWWFWGNVSKNVLISSEIAVLNFDKTLYKANSYAANVPDVTWADGVQSVASLFSSPFEQGNDQGVGYFKKMGVNLTTPYVITRFGYGNLKKENGMSSFDGIFNVIDQKTEKGYTEIKNGPAIQSFGDFKIDATAAFSDKVEKYGTYNYIDVKYSDKAEVAFTLGSSSSEEQLFFYNRTNRNAFSVYAAAMPISQLKIEGHVLGTFGSGDLKLKGETLAYAGRVGWNADTWNVSLMQSLAGLKVNSVWGSDGTVYDDINANTATTQLDAKKSFGEVKAPFTLGLDEKVSYYRETSSEKGHYEGMLSFRTEPFADVDLSQILGKNLTVGLYGVVTNDKLSKDLDSDRHLVTSFNEAGIELATTDAIPFLKNTKLDYAIQKNYKAWESGSKYDEKVNYHSIMFASDVTDKLSTTFGSVIRNDKTDDDTVVPAAFAFGVSIQKLPLPGHPRFWTHFTYSMFPYTDNNYTLRSYAAENEKYHHRTYLLNELDGTKNDCKWKSRVSLGLVWDL